MYVKVIPLNRIGQNQLMLTEWLTLQFLSMSRFSPILRRRVSINKHKNRSEVDMKSADIYNIYTSKNLNTDLYQKEFHYQRVH